MVFKVGGVHQIPMQSTIKNAKMLVLNYLCNRCILSNAFECHAKALTLEFTKLDMFSATAADIFLFVEFKQEENVKCIINYSLAYLLLIFVENVIFMRIWSKSKHTIY